MEINVPNCLKCKTTILYHNIFIYFINFSLISANANLYLGMKLFLGTYIKLVINQVGAQEL